MVGSTAGAERVFSKLKKSIEMGQYYEAHQVSILSILHVITYLTLRFQHLLMLLSKSEKFYNVS